jgi:glycine/D-amino acid oxidase-like deaminating enzyme
LQRILIAGQGIAGSALIFELLKRKVDFRVYDPVSPNGCSGIAAGLINPIVFRRLNAVNHAWPCIRAANEMYSQAESSLGIKCFYSLPLFKPITHEIKQLLGKKALELSAFLDEQVYENPYPLQWKKMQDYILVNKAGYLNTSVFLSALRNRLREEGRLIEKKIDLSRLEFYSDGLNYEGDSFTDVVLCTGYSDVSRFFTETFFNPVKGEILTLAIENFPEESLLVDEKYLVPISPGIFKLGSTYDWDNLNSLPTEDGRNTLIAALDEMIRVPYKILNHEAGVRPASVDRAPVLGQSRIQSNAWIFNGLGTRGVLLAPFLAGVIASAICEHKPIPAGFHIHRFPIGA